VLYGKLLGKRKGPRERNEQEKKNPGSEATSAVSFKWRKKWRQLLLKKQDIGELLKNAPFRCIARISGASKALCGGAWS